MRSHTNLKTQFGGYGGSKILYMQKKGHKQNEYRHIMADCPAPKQTHRHHYIEKSHRETEGAADRTKGHQVYMKCTALYINCTTWASRH